MMDVATERRPLQAVVAVRPRQGVGGGPVWGLTLACGHYCEQVGLPVRQAGCRDCARGAPAGWLAVLDCPAGCWAGRSNPACRTCWGYGAVEPALDWDAARPGQHVVGWWASCDGRADTITVITRQGPAWRAVRRLIAHPDEGGAVRVRERVWWPPAGLGEDVLLAAHDRQARALPCVRSVWAEIRSSHHARTRALVGRLIDGLHAGAS